MKQDHLAIVLEAHRQRDEFVRQGVARAIAAIRRIFQRKRPLGKAA